MRTIRHGVFRLAILRRWFAEPLFAGSNPAGSSQKRALAAGTRRPPPKPIISNHNFSKNVLPMGQAHTFNSPRTPLIPY